MGAEDGIWIPCKPWTPETSLQRLYCHYVTQAGLNLSKPPASSSQVLGLQTGTTLLAKYTSLSFRQEVEYPAPFYLIFSTKNKFEMSSHQRKYSFFF